MTPWDFWGAIQGVDRAKTLPELQSFSFPPNSTPSQVAAPSQLLVGKAQGWDKRAATRSWRSQNLWIRFLPTLLRQINQNEREKCICKHTQRHMPRVGGSRNGGCIARREHCLQQVSRKALFLLFFIVAIEKQGPAWCSTCGQALSGFLKMFISLKLSGVWFPLSNPYLPPAIYSSKITFCFNGRGASAGSCVWPWPEQCFAKAMWLYSSFSPFLFVFRPWNRCKSSYSIQASFVIN